MDHDEVLSPVHLKYHICTKCASLSFHLARGVLSSSYSFPFISNDEENGKINAPALTRARMKEKVNERIRIRSMMYKVETRTFLMMPVVILRAGGICRSSCRLVLL